MPIPFEKTVTLTRTSAGSYVAGEWIAGAESTIDIKATVLPEKDVDILARIGGTSLSGVYKILSKTEMIPADENTGAVGDKFTINGRVYEVVTAEDRTHYGLSVDNYKAWAKLTDDKEP